MSKNIKDFKSFLKAIIALFEIIVLFSTILMAPGLTLFLFLCAAAMVSVIISRRIQFKTYEIRYRDTKKTVQLTAEHNKEILQAISSIENSKQDKKSDHFSGSLICDDLPEEYNIFYSKLFIILLLIMTTIFIFLGLSLVSMREDFWGEIFLIVSLIVFFVLGSKLIRKAPYLQITKKGILIDSFKAGLIEWQDITNVYTQEIGSQCWIYISLREPLKYINRLPRFSRMVTCVNSSTGLLDIGISLYLTSEKPERLLNLIQKHMIAL